MTTPLEKIGIVFFTLIFCSAINAQNYYTLQQALKTAQLNNKVLKTEQFNINIAQSDIITAQLRPNLILNNQTLQLIQPSNFNENTNWYNGYNRQTLWQLTKSFQIAGQRKNKIDVANKTLSLVEKNYAETERNLLADVAEKWVEIWTTQKQLALISIAKTNIDSLVTTNTNRYKNKVITKTDLYRTELLSKQYAIQHKTASQEIINLREEMKTLIGISDDMDIVTEDELFPELTDSLDHLITQSIDRRSDIQSATSAIEVSQSNIQLQKSLAYPQPELGIIWNPQNKISYLGVYANIDLPFFNRNQGEIKKSHLIKEQALQHLSTLKTQLITEVTTSYASYELQQKNIDSFQNILHQSQAILDNVKYSYLKGGTSIIDFLEAQRSWLETQQQYYDALQQYRKSYIKLLYTTGLINQLTS